MVLLWAMLGVVSGPSAAAPAQERLTLMQAYRLAEAHDATLASARAERDAGLEQLPQGRALLLPSLALEGSYLLYNRDDTLLGADEYQYNGYALTLSQPLFDMQNLAGYRLARIQNQNAVLKYQQARQSLILRLAQAYFDLLTAQESLSAAQAKSAALARSLAQAQRRFEVGRAIITEIEEARARNDLARAEAIAARNQLQLKGEALAKLIGRRPGTLAAVRSPLLAVSLQPAQMPAWEQLALEHAPTIAIAHNELMIAVESLKGSRAEHYPSLDLVASYQYSGSNGLAAGDSVSGTRQLGLRFNLPLYSGGATDSRIREARAYRRLASEAERDAREQVLLETRQAYMSVNSGLLRLRALKQALHSSEASLKGTRRGFQVGKRTMLDVLNAQQQLYETRRDLALAKYQYLDSLLQLKAAAGQISEADLMQIEGLLVE